jgi:hypothetical protein
MTITYKDDDCHELIDESPQFEFDASGGKGTRKFYCRSNQLFTKLATAMCLPTPGMEILTCKRWSSGPVNDPAFSTNSTSGCGADWLEVTTYFETLYNSEDDFQYNLDQACETINCGDEINDNYITIPKNLETYEVTMWSTYPTSAMMSVQGAINSAEWRGWPAGCVHFLGATARPVYDFIPGVWKWKVQLRFETRNFSWNYYWDKTVPDWVLGTRFAEAGFGYAFSVFGL